MNIQKVGVLLAMTAIFSASKAKSETTSPDVMRDVFQKPVISAVSTGDLVYTLRPDAKMDVTTSIVTNIHGTQLSIPVTEKQKYPLQVQSEGTGFAFNFNKDGKCPDFSSMAYNAEKDTLYLGLNASTSSVFKITNASQQELLSSKTLKEEKLRNANNEDATLSTVVSPTLISFGDWVLAFQNKRNIYTTSIYHINGIINGNTNITSPIMPKYHSQDTQNIYISDGVKTAKINKQNPTSIDEISTTPTVGLAVINGILYHANGMSLSVNNEERNLYIGSNNEENTNKINHISSDGKMLFVAVENNLSEPVLKGQFINDNSFIQTRYIQADRIVPANNGAWAIRKNQMHFYSNNQLTR